MNKFWDWMLDNEYCKYREEENQYYINWNYDEFTNHMLIGYMLEYLSDKIYFIGIDEMFRILKKGIKHKDEKC